MENLTEKIKIRLKAEKLFQGNIQSPGNSLEGRQPGLDHAALNFAKVPLGKVVFVSQSFQGQAFGGPQLPDPFCYFGDYLRVLAFHAVDNTISPCYNSSL